jgi:hypothetical protein
MNKQLTAQPGTIIAAIEAMQRNIISCCNGSIEKARNEKRLDIIKRVLAEGGADD